MRRIALCVLAATLLFSGCAATREDPFRVDTVIYIPVDPTDAPTESVTEMLTEHPVEVPTDMPTEVSVQIPSEAPAEKETTPKKTTSKGSSSGKNPGKNNSTPSKNQSAGKEETIATQPPETNPAATIPQGDLPEKSPSQNVTEPPMAVPTENPTEPVTEPPSVTPTEIPTEIATEPPAMTPTDTPTEAATEPPTEPPYDPSSYSVGALESAILDQLNSYRKQAGLTELSLSGRLSGIAYIRAQEISNFWSHTRPDGRSYTSAMSDYGYGCATAAENLLYVSGNGDGGAIVDRWMASESNSADILNSSFTTAGIGIYRAGGITYVACILAG